MRKSGKIWQHSFQKLDLLQQKNDQGLCKIDEAAKLVNGFWKADTIDAPKKIQRYANIPHLYKNLDLNFKIAESETSAGAGRALCLFAKMMAVRDSVEDLIGGGWLR